MLKYIWREKKNLIIVSLVILLCSIAIALGIYAQVTNTKITHPEEDESEINYTELKNNFKSNLFTNTINRSPSAKCEFTDDELIYMAYDISNKESGKYDFNAKIPLFKLKTPVTKTINKEIKNIFAQKIKDIVNDGTTNTIYSIDYIAFINDNILSLVVRGTLKEGTNPQRTIIKTYNYDLDNDKLLEINDILEYKNLDNKTVQNKINSEISYISEQTANAEYNVFKRDPNSTIYWLKNADTFFLGEDSVLYIVYSYGNNDFTNVVDLILF